VIERLRLLFRHITYNLRGGFLVRPLAIALILGCAGALLSWFEEVNPSIGDWVPKVLFLSHADPQVAQVILAGIAGSIMTVVSIVFAILLMTLTLASMQFSPRIIVSFARDRTTQWTLGIFLGTFLYCMAALPAAHSLPHPFAPATTVLLTRMAEAFPGAANVAVFGQTEMSPVTCALDSADALRKIGSIGKPVAGVAARIVDDDMKDVPPGEVGEIVYRGPQVMSGYWQNPEATAAAMRGG